MNLVVNEYDWMLLQNGGKSKSKSKDVAFSAEGSSWNGKQCQSKPRFPCACNNCGWKGHKKEDCWEEGGGKAGQALKTWKSCGKKSKDEKPKASRSNADASKPKDEFESDGVWLARTQETPESEPEDIPSTVADSAKSARSSTATHGATIELYDSGTSQHMSPYHEHFLDFRSISPHSIQAADK